MTTAERGIIRRNLWERAIKPTLVLLALVVIAIALYNNFWRLELPGLQRIAGHLFGLTVFFGVGSGTLYVYWRSYFRGATLMERICACLVTPVLYTASEILRVREFFSLGESLYYALSPGFQLILLANLGCMGLAEMFCRLRLRRRGAVVRIVTPLPLAAVLLFLAGLYVILIWGFGVHWFYVYQQGYKALFH
jgi:hypothetical protein